MRRHGLLQAMTLMVCAVGAVAAPPPLARAEASSATTVRTDGLADRVAAGDLHTCAILDAGTVSCWGLGSEGRLGDGDGSDSDIGDNETPATNTINGGIVPLPFDRPAIALTAGDAHTCALLDDGRVTCWGQGSFGRLGYGNVDTIGDGETPADNPINGGIVQLPIGRTATAISAGARHTCAILDNGTVTCWGDGANGRLGYGNENSIGNDPDETPFTNPVNGGIVPLPVGRTATAIATGLAHTCAILDNGTLTCWGSGASGQLGYGNENSIGDNETPATNPVNGGIIALPGGQTAVAVAAASLHTCAILANGDVSCWGAGSFGQLGNGTIDPATTPGLAISLPGGESATAITAYEFHTCVVLYFGSVSCWGGSEFGQLGYGNTNTIGDNPGESPATNPVNGGIVALPGGRTAVTIAAGGHHVCSMLLNGTLTCWGLGASGQLGMGNVNTIGDDETPAANPVAGGIVALPGTEVAAVDVGGLQSCALLGNGSVTCWGAGVNGRLGYGTSPNVGDNEFPATNSVGGGLLDLPNRRTATSVSTFNAHSCALLDDGTVTCWGSGSNGKLGYGNGNQIGDDETPAGNPVNDGIVALPGGRTATAITTGTEHTCAILDNGTVTCWGGAGTGRLGYANSNAIGDDETPAGNPVNGGIVALPGGRKAVAISAGDSHTCALLDNGTMTCWGEGLFGSLGYGNGDIIGDNETPADNPVNGGILAMPGGRKVVAISAGGTLTCALLDDATLSCWGGNSTQTPVSLGLKSLPQSTVVDVSVGVAHACAVFASGAMTCWGEGDNGRLGSGSTADVTVPTTTVSLPAGRTALRVAAGGAHTCALLDDRTVTCWGLGTAGRLGYSNITSIGDDELPSANPVDGGIVRTPAHLSVVQYQALQPARLVDTRPTGTTVDGEMTGFGPIAGNTSFTLPVAGRGGVPVDATSVTLSVAAVTPSASGFITVWPCAAAQPNASSINYASGTNTANTVITGIAGGVCIYSSKTTHIIADVVGYTPRSSSYVSLTPTRYADTRASGTTFDNQFDKDGQRAAGSTFTVSVGGRGELGMGVETVALNVVAVQPAASGFLTVFPCGEPTPNASNLNYRTGVTAANMVITRLPQSGELCVFTSQPTHLIIDVVGEFVGDSPTTTTLRTFTPGRLVDTRAAGATTDSRYTNVGLLVPNAANTYQIANRFPLAGADVAVLNITAVNPTAGGFVTVWPCDQLQPTASSVNFVAGTTRAVQVVSALSTSGTVCVASSRAIHLIIDVSGSTL